MTVYIVLFLWCAFLCLMRKSYDYKTAFEIATVILLAIIAGTRYHIGGSDYNIYEAAYTLHTPKLNELFQMDRSELQLGWEFGYTLLTSAVKTLGFSFYGFTLLHSLFFFICLYIGMKRYTDNFMMVVLVFLYKLFFYNTFVSMRQSVTLAIFFLILKFIEEKKIIKYYLWCIIATFIHGASLVLFLLYPLLQLKLTKQRYVWLNVVFFITLAISYFDFQLLRILGFVIDFLPYGRIQYRTTELFLHTPASSLGVMHTIEFFFLSAFIYIYYDRILNQHKNAELILKLFLCMLPFVTLLRNYEMLTRVIDYFTITYGVLLGYIYLTQKQQEKILLWMLTAMWCAAGYFRFIILFSGGDLLPYRSFVFENVSIFNDATWQSYTVLTMVIIVLCTIYMVRRSSTAKVECMKPNFPKYPKPS